MSHKICFMNCSLNKSGFFFYILAHLKQILYF